ncbi:RTA1 like protein-domain-containing protein [Aspergillus pseudodeflectus]|uniref:RTA1 like protein-domain-containing protein n=1 Tax=Aspergillus pseudodeflectus TaxID=176178 RepID=A0ABR4L6H0_9EURO
MASDDSNNIYGYEPSIAAGVIFILLFGATTAYHGWQVFRARAFYFIPFFIGGIFQIIGYLMRCLSNGNTDSIPLYALQTVLILLAPALYAASIYMVLGRLMVFLGAEHHSIVRVNWMTKIFVAGDVVSFLMQCGAGGLMSGDDPDTRTLGENLTIVALIIQVLFFTFFLITSIIFHKRINTSPTAQSRETSLHWTLTPRTLLAKNWITLLIALYTVSALILIRSVFRLVEFIDGYGGFLMTHEAFIYIFDTLPMFVVMVVMNLWHPCFVIRDGKGGYIPRGDFENVPLR